MRLPLLSQIFGAIAVLPLLSASAQASVLCSSDPQSHRISVFDVTLNGRNSNDCYGFASGNDSEQALNTLRLSWGNNWTLVAKDDLPGVDSSAKNWFNDIDFTFNATSGSSGTWTVSSSALSQRDPASPLSFDLVAALKAGPGYHLYWFKDVMLDGTDMGTWRSRSLNKNGTALDLSHLSLYFSNDFRISPISAKSYDVAEPGVLAVLGMGLLGLAIARRRKRSA